MNDFHRALRRWSMLSGVLLVIAPLLAHGQSCEDWIHHDFSGIADAPAQLLEAETVAATDPVPAYCRLRGYVHPNIGIELRLPADDWNGGFFYAGCTGHCGIGPGTPWADECNYPLEKGYACVVSDMGHRAGGGDGLWAWRNLEAKVNFAYRATHRTTVAGKAITEAFYGREPRRSYFMGCSTGGRQGLILAQRFPWHFDGIIVGAPVVSQAGTSLDFIWNLQHLSDEDGRRVLGASELELLHEAALAAADAAGVLVDGVIEDPAAVRPDPHALVCQGDRRSDCLTPAQAEAAARVYAGPHDADGKPLYPGAGLYPGSEHGWARFMPPDDPEDPRVAGRSGIDSMRYMVTDWGPDWDYRDFDFEDGDHRRLREGESLYSASNPDLRAFRDAGGHLLLYQGWADPIIAPQNSIDYHASVARAMGGEAAAEAFSRLYMVPGMDHCIGGDGAFAIDWISVMEAWVEDGEAPEALDAAHWDGQYDASSMIRRFPFADGEPAYRRTIEPHRDPSPPR